DGAAPEDQAPARERPRAVEDLTGAAARPHRVARGGALPRPLERSPGRRRSPRARSARAPRARESAKLGPHPLSPREGTRPPRPLRPADERDVPPLSPDRRPRGRRRALGVQWGDGRDVVDARRLPRGT